LTDWLTTEGIACHARSTTFFPPQLEQKERQEGNEEEKNKLLLHAHPALYSFLAIHCFA